VEARPTAHLDRAREVLLVWFRPPVPAAAPAPPPVEGKKESPPPTPASAPAQAPPAAETPPAVREGGQ